MASKKTGPKTFPRITIELASIDNVNEGQPVVRMMIGETSYVMLTARPSNLAGWFITDVNRAIKIEMILGMAFNYRDSRTLSSLVPHSHEMWVGIYVRASDFEKVKERFCR